MDYLVRYTDEMCAYYVRPRAGEQKIGERFQLIPQGLPLQEGLAASTARYVLLGLPEDLGVRANYGRGGAHTEWHPALSFLANVQSNRFLNGSEILLLGHIDFSDLLQRAKKLDLHQPTDMASLRQLVAEVDERVYPLIQTIVASGKTPIVVGGGHNNAYGMIKGTSLALNEKLHILNIDAHTDLREPEGRHSGNGFKYAWNDGFLQQYFIFGLHQNYTPEHIFSFIDGEKNISFSLFEDIIIKQKISIREAVHSSLQFLKSEKIGLELDMDAIQNMPSSARTSSGFMANDVRAIINQVAENRKVNYVHICEGAPTLTHKKADIKTGKLIAYLITDFIKAQNYFLDEKID